MPDCTNCSRCGSPRRDDCVNGHIIIDDLRSAECPPLKIKRTMANFERRVPSYVFSATAVKASPLFTPRSASSPGIDRTKDNLFIRGVPWMPTFVSHLKLVLFCKPLMTFNLVTDARIKDVFLGAEAYKGRPSNKRDTIETFNVIADLVSASDFDLVIVHLGRMLYKNIAAADVLLEALQHRVDARKPTWLFQSSDPHSAWNLSRSADVESYVEEHFQVLDLYQEGDQTKETSDNGITVDEMEEENVPEFRQNQFALTPSEEADTSVDTTDLDVLMGTSTPKKKKYSKNRNWRR